MSTFIITFGVFGEQLLESPAALAGCLPDASYLHIHHDSGPLAHNDRYKTFNLEATYDAHRVNEVMTGVFTHRVSSDYDEILSQLVPRARWDRYRRALVRQALAKKADLLEVELENMLQTRSIVPSAANERQNVYIVGSLGDDQGMLGLLPDLVYILRQVPVNSDSAKSLALDIHCVLLSEELVNTETDPVERRVERRAVSYATLSELKQASRAKSYYALAGAQPVGQGSAFGEFGKIFVIEQATMLDKMRSRLSLTDYMVYMLQALVRTHHTSKWNDFAKQNYQDPLVEFSCATPDLYLGQRVSDSALLSSVFEQLVQKPGDNSDTQDIPKPPTLPSDEMQTASFKTKMNVFDFEVAVTGLKNDYRRELKASVSRKDKFFTEMDKYIDEMDKYIDDLFKKTGQIGYFEKINQVLIKISHSLKVEPNGGNRKPTKFDTKWQQYDAHLDLWGNLSRLVAAMSVPVIITIILMWIGYLSLDHTSPSTIWLLVVLPVACLLPIIGLLVVKILWERKFFSTLKSNIKKSYLNTVQSLRTSIFKKNRTSQFKNTHSYVESNIIKLRNAAQSLDRAQKVRKTEAVPEQPPSPLPTSLQEALVEHQQKLVAKFWEQHHAAFAEALKNESIDNALKLLNNLCKELESDLYYRDAVVEFLQRSEAGKQYLVGLWDELNKCFNQDSDSVRSTVPPLQLALLPETLMFDGLKSFERINMNSDSFCILQLRFMDPSKSDESKRGLAYASDRAQRAACHTNLWRMITLQSGYDSDVEEVVDALAKAYALCVIDITGDCFYWRKESIGTSWESVFFYFWEAKQASSSDNKYKHFTEDINEKMAFDSISRKKMLDKQLKAAREKLKMPAWQMIYAEMTFLNGQI